MIANLRLWKKFLLIGLLALAMAAPPSVLLVRASWQSWRAAQDELAGMAPARDLLSLIRLSQKHRGLSSSVLGGNAGMAAERTQVQSELLKVAGQARNSSQPYAGVAKGTDELVADLRTLLAAVEAGQATPATSFERHTALIQRELEWLADIVDASKLALDPEAASYYLVVAALDKQPKVTELLGQARARGSLALTRHEMSGDERLRLSAAASQAQTASADTARALRRVQEASPETAAALTRSQGTAQAALASMLQLLDKELVSSTELRYASADYFKVATQAIDAQFEFIQSAFDTLAGLLQDRARQTLQHLLITLATMLLMGGAGAWVMVSLSRGVSRSVRQAGEAAAALARGDLTHRIQGQSRDEIGQMASAMGEAITQLDHLVDDVRSRVDAVALASQQIAAGNRDLSARTESQASSLEQTASAMAEMTASVGQTAQHAQQAQRLADEARDDAHRGQTSFDEVARTMENIAQSSRRIGEIVAVIDGIAFQTNLLALNAAVEAARAGEHGRGFAVVAGDVRALAGRSAQAALQIRQLIEESAERVALGGKQSIDSAQSILQVVSHIDQMAQLVHQIAMAANEQSRGIGEVNTAVAQIEQGTQHNAALVEQTAAAALSLSEQAGRMVQSIAVFRTAEHAG